MEKKFVSIGNETLAYLDEGQGDVVLMLHGHPGGDKNLDIGEALRANGFAVAVMSYRGVWGSHGNYLLSHNIEDVISAVDFLREKGVLIVPGSGFNWKQPDHFRLVYLPRIEDLEQATQKLADFLHGYKQK